MKSMVKIWDLPIRLFHWSLVLLIIVAFVSINRQQITVHQWAGTAILVLVVFRVIWGIFGSSTARFRDFIRPTSIISYVRNSRSPTEGHNPLGGLMVIALLTVIFIQCFTGLFMEDNTYLFQDSPLASVIGSQKRSIFKTIHFWGEYVLYGMIALHLLAVFVYAVFKKKYLVRSMISGQRPVNALDNANHQLRYDRPILALVLVIVLSVIVFLALWYAPTRNILIGLLK